VTSLRGRILTGGSYGKMDYLYFGNRGSRDLLRLRREEEINLRTE